jgi:hypothetical protein
MADPDDSCNEISRPNTAQHPNIEPSAIPASSTVIDSTAFMDATTLEPSALHDAGSIVFSDIQWSGRPSGVAVPNIRPSTFPGDDYNVIPVQVINYHQNLDWKMSRDGNPVFSSVLEKESIQRNVDQAGARHAAFWTHSVRYEPSFSEPNIYRTVQIDHIPKAAEIKDILNEVCFGKIESVQLVDIGNVKGPQGPRPSPHKFARIVYIEEDDASRFQRYAHNKPLLIFGQPVRVYVQMAPTYPRTEEVDGAISRLGMSRILGIVGLTAEQRQGLPTFLWKRGLDLVALELRPVSENDLSVIKVVMEFRSILHAILAQRALGSDNQQAIRFVMEADYCEREIGQ